MQCTSISLFVLVPQSREPLLKRKDQYIRPPCTNKFRSAAFENGNNIYYFTKQATLMRRSTVPSLPLQLEFLAQSMFVNSSGT